MSGQGARTPPANGATRLERAVELLLAGVELLRAEIDEARNGDERGGDQGEHSTTGDERPAAG